jgi:hypothetical protein
MPDLISPDGSRIVGTRERIYATSYCTFVRSDDGIRPLDYNDTEIDWDSQETVCDDGEITVVDDDGYQYKLSECRFEGEDEPLPPPPPNVTEVRSDHEI